MDDEVEYEYVWSGGGLDIPVPKWMAEILDVPLFVRFELFLLGVCTGLILAAIAVFAAFFSAH